VKASCSMFSQILKLIPILKIANMDELYAYVEITPFTPNGAHATSNIVHGQWGAAGND